VASTLRTGKQFAGASGIGLRHRSRAPESGARLEAEREKQAHLHDHAQKLGDVARKRWQTQCERNADALTKPCHLEPEPEPEPQDISRSREITTCCAVDATSEPPKRRKRRQPRRCLGVLTQGGMAYSSRLAGVGSCVSCSGSGPGAAKATAWLKANPSSVGAHRRSFVVEVAYVGAKTMAAQIVRLAASRKTTTALQT
jgi:hypothetical protein